MQVFIVISYTMKELMKMKRYYIAYGSNINMFRMKGRCPNAELLGTATLNGWELWFKKSKTGAYLTIEENPTRSIPVVVWSISADDEATLDRCEGFPVCYYKRRLKVKYKGISTGKERTVHGFTYIMPEEREYGTPTDGYMNICIAGYRTFKFDRRALYEAEYKSKQLERKRRGWYIYEP